MENNIILNTDSYKVSHWLQYPPKTEKVFSYVEARGPANEETLFFGLQIFLKKYLSRPVTLSMIREAKEILDAHGEPFNEKGWIRLVEKYNGYFPVIIKAVPEGTVVPVRNALVTIENLDPEFYWVTSYLETALLRAVWYGTTVATISKKIKNLISDYLEKTGDPSLLPFKLHDFGARGASSLETAIIGGTAHLVNFMGTDTISGLVGARTYYNAGTAGFSIPAAEHSTMTTWGGKDGESLATKNMLDQFAKKGKLVSIVGDSYDIFNFAENIIGGKLKEQILKSGATVVVRPDSGDPASVVNKVVYLLDKKFGSSINEKGFRVLNPAVRVIQGDGINYDSIKEILFRLKNSGYSADNIAFGMGGALLQKIDRDTFQFAMKASAIKIDGKWQDVYKNPVTKDIGLDKVSKRGRLMLYKNPLDKKFFTDRENVDTCPALETVWSCGKLTKEYSFEEVRNNSNM